MVFRTITGVHQVCQFPIAKREPIIPEGQLQERIKRHDRVLIRTCGGRLKEGDSLMVRIILPVPHLSQL